MVSILDNLRITLTRSTIRVCGHGLHLICSHSNERPHFSRFPARGECVSVQIFATAVTAQTLATRAYRAVNRVCLGKARRVRFKIRGRGLESIEGKRSNNGRKRGSSCLEALAFPTSERVCTKVWRPPTKSLFPLWGNEKRCRPNQNPPSFMRGSLRLLYN